MQQQEEVIGAADSISSISNIVKVPHISDTIAASLTSQVQDLSVTVNSTKAACIVTDPSSLERQKLTLSPKFDNSLNTAVAEISVPRSANIVKKPDCVARESVIHWIDKDVTAKSNTGPSDLREKSLALSHKKNKTKKFVNTPELTLRDRVTIYNTDFNSINSVVTEAQKRPKPESLLAKKSQLSNNHLHSSSSIEMSKRKPPVTDNPESQIQPNFKDGPSGTSEVKDSDITVTIVPANPQQRPFVSPACTMAQSISGRSILPRPGLMTPPVRPKFIPGKKSNYNIRPLDFKQPRNSFRPRVQCPATVVSDPKSMQPGSAVQDQFSPQRSAESFRTETFIKTPDSNMPLNLSKDGCHGFRSVHAGGSNTVSGCTPVRYDARIGEFHYNRPLVTPPVPRHNVDVQPANLQPTMKRKFEPYVVPVDLSIDVVPPVMSLYASQLQQNFLQRRTNNTTSNNDSSLLSEKDNMSPELCFDEDFLAEPSIQNSDSSLMNLPIHDFFADEDITFEEMLTKYS